MITVRGELYARAPDERTSEWRRQRYADAGGFRRIERRTLQRESDFAAAEFERCSEDNGRTWGGWTEVSSRGYGASGDDETAVYEGVETWNPRHRHFVSLVMKRVFLGGHTKAYEAYWGRGEAGFSDHCLLAVRPDGSGERAGEPIRYEGGTECDPARPDGERAFFGGPVDVMENGEIVGTIAADVRACCRLRGLDVRDVFPSCPQIMYGLIAFRGRFNESRGRYDLAFSRPAVISDLRSSRGVCEPQAIALPSGRILAIFRGSNAERAAWHTRIEPGTPAHTWFCFSDDGGRTFTEPAPWHFDDREVFYSPASISALFRDARDGRIYWIGNLTGHTAYGDAPRYPLVMCEIGDRGLPRKETLAVIDTRREGDGPDLQLSNFCILQDRETGRIELYLTKLGQRAGALWHADCHRYLIDVKGGP